MGARPLGCRSLFIRIGSATESYFYASFSVDLPLVNHQSRSWWRNTGRISGAAVLPPASASRDRLAPPPGARP